MGRSGKGGILLAGGAIGLGLLVLAAATSEPARRIEERVMQDLGELFRTLFRKTAAHEGYYWDTNPNTDGAGLSFGFLQWPQSTGNLGKLLAYMREWDAPTFDAAMGGTANALAVIEHTRAAKMEPLNGANLWEEPWRGRFTKLGGPVVKAASLPDPSTSMQRAMWTYASTLDGHMAAAVANAQALDVVTERGLVLCYNRAVQQGVGGSTAPRREIVELWRTRPSARPAKVNDRLAQYAWQCAWQFRRTTPPANVAYNSHGLVWRPVTTEWSELRTGDYHVARVACPGVWHVFAGSTDLYDGITHRSSDILLDPNLHDNPVALPNA